MSARQAPFGETSQPIDAVVTWVDGSDPIHVAKRNAVLGRGTAIQHTSIPAGLEATRFEDNGELWLCLNSIRRYAPWIRTIFLVTDQQRPAFLTEQERRRLGVSIVDHKVVFAGHEDILPTFNSLSIETVLHRIPDLAERYLYFNDDFILLEPVSERDFFTEDGVVLRGAWRKLQNYGRLRLAFSKLLNRALKRLFGINRAMSVLQQIRGAQLAGAHARFYKVGHSPYPIRKGTLEAFFARHPSVLRRNITYQFRNLDQYATTALANHLEILARSARLLPATDCSMVCFNRDSRRQVKRKIEKLRGGNAKFLCIQSLEEGSPEDRDALLAAAKAKIF